MSWFGRIAQITRNLIISWKKDPEPEVILEQAVTAMQDDLFKMRQAVAAAVASQKKTQRQIKQAIAQSSAYAQQAKLALDEGHQGIAADFLAQETYYRELAKSISANLQNQVQMVDTIKRDLQDLESLVLSVKLKQDSYIARIRQAETKEIAHQILRSIKEGPAFLAFDKLEQKVLQLEAHAELLEELSHHKNSVS